MEPNSKPTMPCAACKHLRRRCTEDCLFLPYFPASEPEKFTAVHRVFGASNVSKMLQVITHALFLLSTAIATMFLTCIYLIQQDVPVTDRGDAAASLVYEARARLHEPVYGCVALIASLQKQVFQLQSELDEASATTMRLRTQLSSVLSFIVSSPQSPPLACAAEEGSSHEHNKQLQQCQYGYSNHQIKDYYNELEDQ